MDYSLPGSSVFGILQARILEWLPFPPPGNLPPLGIKPSSPPFPAVAGRFFTTEPPGKPSFHFTLSSVYIHYCYSQFTLPLLCLKPILYICMQLFLVPYRFLFRYKFYINIFIFPGGPVVRTPCFHCMGTRFNPWPGN